MRMVNRRELHICDLRSMRAGVVQDLGVYSRAMKLKRISLMAIAWSCLAFIAFATLSPIGLRPHLASAHREYLAAFAAVSLLFSLIYPSRPILILALIVCAAAFLETLQVLTIDRHARVADFVFKTMGAVCGSLAAAIYRRAVSFWSDPRPE